MEDQHGIPCIDPTHVDGCAGAAGGEHEARRFRVIRPDSGFYAQVGAAEKIVDDNVVLRFQPDAPLAFAFGRSEVAPVQVTEPATTREVRNHPPVNGCTIAGPHPCILSIMAPATTPDGTTEALAQYQRESR